MARRTPRRASVAPRYTATRRSHRTGAPDRSPGRTRRLGSSSTRASNAFLDGALLRHRSGARYRAAGACPGVLVLGPPSVGLDAVAMPYRSTMAPFAGLTPTAARLVWAITVLSVAHHVDHLLRDVTGWPVEDEFNPFIISLFVSPGDRRRAGPVATRPLRTALVGRDSPERAHCSSLRCTSARSPVTRWPESLVNTTRRSPLSLRLSCSHCCFAPLSPTVCTSSA